MFVQVRFSIEGGMGGKVLPGYQLGGRLFINDIAVGHILTINDKKFQVTGVNNNYFCDRLSGVQLNGGTPHVVLKEIEVE